MVGASLEEVLGQNFLEIESWKVSGLLGDAKQALADGVSLRREIHVRSTFGKEVWLECRVSRFASQGQPHLLLIVDDIYERKRAEEERRKLAAQVQHSQKLESLGVLAGGIAHDFNNMLVGILGNAELALHELPLHSPARARCSDIVKNSRRCAELTNQMLAYSGKGKLLVEDVDLRMLIEDMADLLRSSVSKKVKLDFDLPSELPAIHADASQVCQVVLNLVINASEAIGDKPGRITVSARQETCERGCSCRKLFPDGEAWPGGPQIVLEVSDTGSGMDDETRSRIFDPFFSTKFAGRGLGLAAVHGIVRGHRGGLEVDSEPGRGTRFRVCFPALERSGIAARRVGEASDDDWHGSGTVLLADDEETVRRVAKAMVETMGFKVITAKDGEEAVEIFRKHQSDIICVIIDFKMPRMDGVEACCRLREIRADVPILLSSGFGEAEASDRFGKQGLSGFIQKPYGLEALRERLSGVLGE
jgi:signal transduction histidine kinase/CheY-like chemotaxis protein